MLIRLFKMRRELEARLSGLTTLEAVARRERTIWESRNELLNHKYEELQLRADDLDRREQELIREKASLGSASPEPSRQSG